jgi:hypothetical protein
MYLSFLETGHFRYLFQGENWHFLLGGMQTSMSAGGGLGYVDLTEL